MAVRADFDCGGAGRAGLMGIIRARGLGFGSIGSLIIVNFFSRGTRQNELGFDSYAVRSEVFATDVHF